MRAAAPLVDNGFSVVDQSADNKHFGNALLMVTRGSVRTRIIRERGLWFVEIGSTKDPREWFDARLILRLLRDTVDYSAPLDDNALSRLLLALGQAVDKWEILFHDSVYPTTRAELKSLERASAQERFGYR